jgi:nitronate monooxygenase
MVREPVDLIRSEVADLRARKIERFGVNLIPASTDPLLLDAQISACIDLGVPVVCLFWGAPLTVVNRLRDAGTLVVCQVGSITEAHIVEQAGAQIVIAQGVEAGGHVRGKTPLYELLAEVAAGIALPVLAAGGLVDGSDLATVLSLGAQGAVLGTALIATPESFAHDFHKQRLVQARSSDTVLTDMFHINWPRGAMVRVLANSVTRGEHGDAFAKEKTVIGDEEGRPIYLFSTDSPLRSMSGDFEAMALYAGKGVDRVTAIVAAADRVRAIVEEASALLEAHAASSVEAIELTSPACSAHEMDERYMGFLSRGELVTALNELLEAERAGARVTLRTAAEAADPMVPMIKAIHRDEARWCGVLTNAVYRLEGKPSLKTGAFYDKAMAIAGIPTRLAFLNRGQQWVARRLKALLPTIRDERIHADLTAMLLSHEQNIALVSAKLPSVAEEGP